MLVIDEVSCIKREIPCSDKNRVSLANSNYQLSNGSALPAGCPAPVEVDDEEGGHQHQEGCQGDEEENR